VHELRGDLYAQAHVAGCLRASFGIDSSKGSLQKRRMVCPRDTEEAVAELDPR